MRLFVYFLLVCSPYLVFCQSLDDGKRDNVWLFGYGSYSQMPFFGRSVIDFADLSAPHVYREDRDMDFRQTCSSICDVEGNLLFYTNGIYIANTAHKKMMNGDSLSPEGWTFSYPSGLPVSQGTIALPIPEKENEYMLFHGQLDFPAGIGPIYSKLYYSKVDMELAGGLGGVTEKNVVLLQDTLFVGKITATRHGNGRDWWLIIPESHTSQYYSYLLTPDSLYAKGAQAIGASILPGVGQAIFTPDGSRYLRFDLHAAGVGNNLNIYDFDRCTGLFSSPIELVNFDSMGAAGLAVSANSRFVYVITSRYVRQYDLWATDIASSLDTVAIYDGFVSPLGHNTWFYLAQLAPDNKIYVNTPSGSNFLHVIQEPDKKGEDCQFEQHGLELPSRNAFTMPNFPNFRLGPLDGSPCDTLGLDNHPVAKYRYDQDTNEYLSIRFTDLSYYEPSVWGWDFGDGSFSNEVNPVHTYSQDGIYEICLTVANNYGINTYCRTLQIGTTATGEATPEVKLTVFPNPAREATNFILSDYLPQHATLYLHTATGQIVHQQRITYGWNLVPLEPLAPGLYFYEVRDEGKILQTGKLVKVE